MSFLIMQKYKKIAITGANGFLGTNVVLELARRGVEMRAILRNTNPTIDNCPSLKAIRGNILEFNDLKSCVEGCDAIIHIAAITDQSLLSLDDYTDFNVAALENVIAVAREVGVRRVIFVSSSNTIGNGTLEKSGDESTPINGAYKKQLYGLSKVAAERVLREATDIEGVIINPCFMLGSYDHKPTSGKIIFMGYGKRFIFSTGGGKNIVDVQGAAVAICNALELGRRGENYLLAGENITFTNFYKLLCKITGQKSTIITAPQFLVTPLGWIGDLLRLCGIKSQVSSVNRRIVCAQEYYSGAKAERELGLPRSSVETCTRSAIEWFKEQSMLK